MSNYQAQIKTNDEKLIDAAIRRMIECADCGLGFTPGEDGGRTLCDDCIENRHYWEEIDAEKGENNASKI